MNFESNKPCVCCGKFGDGMVCFHHLMTRKAYPEHTLKPWNQISVCQEHHNLFHARPLSEVAEKFTTVSKWLIDNNWVKNEISGKWFHDTTKD